MMDFECLHACGHCRNLHTHGGRCSAEYNAICGPCEREGYAWAECMRPECAAFAVIGPDGLCDECSNLLDNMNELEHQRRRFPRLTRLQ